MINPSLMLDSVRNAAVLLRKPLTLRTPGSVSCRWKLRPPRPGLCR